MCLSDAASAFGGRAWRGVFVFVVRDTKKKRRGRADAMQTDARFK